MARRDIFPDMFDERNRGRFRLANSRREELTMQQELKDVGKKSIEQIKTNREIKKFEPVPESENTIRKLAPEFKHKRNLEKRKTHPVFHDGDGKTPRPKTPKYPSLPMYNPLDKESSVLKAKENEKSKKLPFSKESTVTTEEMKKPRVTSLGIVPLPHGETLPEVNVVMEGIPAMKHDDPVIGPVERANTAALVEPETGQVPPLYLPQTPVGERSKPAILGTIGTTQTVQFTARPAPPAKPMTHLKVPRGRSAKSVMSQASSFTSMDISLPDENQDLAEGEDDLGPLRRNSADEQHSQQSGSVTMNTMKSMLEEAKKIASPEASTAAVKARRREKEKREELRKAEAAKSKPPPKAAAAVDKKRGKAKPIKEEEKDAERSVDEIIASLKEQATSGQVSEADRKIQEIMDKVVSRTKAVLGDLAPAELLLEEQPTDDMEEQGQNIGLGNDLVGVIVTEATSSVLEESGTEKDMMQESQESTEEQDPELPQVPTEEVFEQGMEEEPTGEDKFIDEALEMIAEAKAAEAEEEITETQSVDLTADLSQAWEDLMAPTEVEYEDIINVTAKPSKLHPKQTLDTEADISSQAPSSLLGSWTVKASELQGSSDNMKKHQRGNIHHFCTVREDLQMPDPYRGVWRRYHVPSKYDYVYKDSGMDAVPASVTPGITQEVGEPISSPSLHNSTSHIDRDALDRQQSFMAQKILEEANQIKEKEESKLETWQSRAQQVFDQSQLTIDGKKMPIKSDESFLYWTPAPPKWDVPPKDVKSILFPEYHGAALNMVGEIKSQTVEQEESEEEEEEITKEDPEITLARERTLTRVYQSAQDLTELVKNHLADAEHLVPEKTRDIDVVLRLPHLTFTDELEDKDSPQYEQRRAEMELVLESVMSNILGEKYRGIGSINFSGGSLMVHYSVHVPESSPPELSQEIQSALILAVKRGMFGDLDVDTNSVKIEDEVKSKADLLKRQLSQMSPVPSQTVRPVISERKEVSDLTTMTRREHSDIQAPGMRERHNSAPGACDDDDDMLMIYQDYTSAMEEIKMQQQQLREDKSLKKRQIPDDKTLAEAIETYEENNRLPGIEEDIYEETSTLPDSETKKSKFLLAVAKHKEDKPTPAELALEAGRAYVLLPNKAKRKKKKIAPADLARIEAIEAFALARPSKLERRASFTEKKRNIERELLVPKRIRERRVSLSGKPSFEDYKKERNPKPEESDDREWVRDIWGKWFDERFPPTPPDSDTEEGAEEQSAVKEEYKPAKRKLSEASTVYSEDVVVHPMAEKEEEFESLELLQEEVERLNGELANLEKPNPFLLCRRGAILRKLGRIKPALEDLTSAIQLEPLLLDAYWHRHFIYVLINNKKSALEDLNVILKYNKVHSGAYRSRANIHREKGDVTMSIINYTQAIKFNPDDDNAYFQRAEMYEERGEMLLAMEDYAQTFKINPGNIEALFRHGMHYQKNGNWRNAIDDFTRLLKQDPYNARTRMVRGRVYAQLGQWNNAVEDLSAAIHLDPTNAQAFYYRACLLRKLHPKKALQDYSVSLQLDDSDDNIMAFLHRGILYNDIGRHEDAIPDFEAVLKLDKDVASAHVSLGLIFMQKLQNHQRAIKKFSNAIKADPTYLKAYICRAEAYTKIHDIKSALLDITRAIHLKPDLNHLYMYRGQLVLKLGNLDLAAYCVRHAADLNAGLGQSPTQQAIVQSFLKNYDKAIEALEGATRVKPVPPLFMLLGKTRMKARLWKDAVEAFEKALDLVKPWQAKHTWPPEAAEMFYLIGMCQMEMRDYFNAHDAFNNAIQVDKKLADAFYWRGMTRMKLKQSKGIQDFNRALALSPDLFQAYLSRAAYYGLRGQYSKGILNCNEAIRLQPTSIRGYLYRGALKYHIKAYALAIRDLSQALAIDNTCALAFFNRAVCHHDSGNFNKALQDYGIVLLVGDYLSLKVLNNRGLLYFETKDYKNALHDFLMAASVNPRDKRIHHTLGLCYHKLDRLQEAVKSFTKALQLDAYFLDAIVGRGNVFMDFGHEIGHTMARHDYERALHLNPAYLPARVNLAYNLQVSGKYQQAWRQFTTAISISKARFKPALEGRAIINLQMSDTFAAFQDINASVNIKPTAELLTNRGVVHQFMSDRVNAMRDYQEAVKLDPKYALAYFNAANIYFHNRQFTQALSYYSSAINFNGKDESAYLNRAITKVMLKDAQGALSDFEAAIKLSPHSAHMYFNRGNLYTSLSMFEKAEADYSKALQIKPDDPLVHKRRADVRGKLGQKEEAIADYKYAILIQSQHNVS